jgi:hypothetical protein
MFDLKTYIRGLDAEGKEWLKWRYVQCRIEILKDSTVGPEERYFLFRHLDECSKFLEEEMEEAEK